MNLFERASREAFRFTSVRGLLTTEDLWDLPLKSKNMMDLDSVAKTANGELKLLSEESFVTESNPKTELAQAKLDIVKHIIAVKQAENAAAASAAARKAEREKLKAILGDKQDAELKGLSADELRARIDALG